MEMYRYCATVNGGACIANSTCIEVCASSAFFGYSDGCSACFGDSSTCSLENGCTLLW
jgi:hypothetical protein